MPRPGSSSANCTCILRFPGCGKGTHARPGPRSRAGEAGRAAVAGLERAGWVSEDAGGIPPRQQHAAGRRAGIAIARGWAYVGLGDPDDAARSFEAALDQDEENPEALVGSAALPSPKVTGNKPRNTWNAPSPRRPTIPTCSHFAAIWRWQRACPKRPRPPFRLCSTWCRRTRFTNWRWRGLRSLRRTTRATRRWPPRFPPVAGPRTS